MVDKKRIAIELAKGTPPKDISLAFGITPSYITQLMSDERFVSKVEALKDTVDVLEGEFLSEEEIKREKEKKELHTAIDDAWDYLESEALGSLAEKVSKNLITRPNELLRVAQLANAAKRKTSGDMRENVNGGDTYVSVSLSQVLHQRIQHIQTQVNSNNQVIEVNGQTIVNKDKKSILGELEKIQNTYKEKTALPPKKPDLTLEDLEVKDGS